MPTSIGELEWIYRHADILERTDREDGGIDVRVRAPETACQRHPGASGSGQPGVISAISGKRVGEIQERIMHEAEYSPRQWRLASKLGPFLRGLPEGFHLVERCGFQRIVTLCQGSLDCMEAVPELVVGAP